MEHHFAPARARAPADPVPPGVEAAQLGVGIEGGLEELVHGVTVALQSHPFPALPLGPPPPNPPDPNPNPNPNPAQPEGWTCISLDFRNFFNTISRPAIFRALLASPAFSDLYPFLSQIYSKDVPARLWADLGEREWDDILSLEGVHQGCSFGSFLASLALQPILVRVAQSMTHGMVAAYCDDVKIVGPCSAARDAYAMVCRLARDELGIEEDPTKGSVMWEGEGSPNPDDLALFPPAMPGVASRITHDRHLGVFIGDARPESVQAVKGKLMDKFHDKGRIMSRLPILSDPQIRFQLLRCCVSTRPGFWLRTMSPSLTHDAASWYDSRMRDCMSDIACAPISDATWLHASLPGSLGGLGLTSAMSTRHAAHYASWAASWANVTRMFPTAVPLSTADLATSALPFAVGLRDAHATTNRALTALEDNLNQHPLPPLAPKSPSLPEPTEIGQRQPHAQKRFATISQCARWLDGFDAATPAHRAVILSQSQQGAMFAFNAVPTVGHGAMLPASFVNAVQLRLRLPLSLLAGITTCKCGCAMDPFGDHVLSCPSCLCDRTPGHDLVVDVVASMARHASKHVSYSSRRPRAASLAYSPNWCPDITLIHGARDGNHVLVDVTCPSVVTRAALPAACHMPLATAIAATAMKHARYGNVHPHTVLPFVVEHAGGINKEGMQFFRMCRDAADNKLNARASDLSSWSSKGFSNFFLQSLSLANLKGLGHLFMVTAASIRAA